MKLLDWNRNGKVDAADIVLSIMMLALLGAIAAYFIGMAHFGDKIDPGTKVSIEGHEYEIGGMTADAAEDKLLKELAFDLTINGRTDSYKIKASDVEELKLEGNTPAEIIASEDAWRYGSGTKFEKVIEAGVVRTVDEDAVGKLVDKFSEVSAKAEQPKDAYIDGDGNHFWIVKEEEGAALDPKKTVAAICEAMANGQTELDLDKADCYKHPAVYEDNEALVSEWRRVEHFFTQKLSLNMTGAVEPITEEQLRDWCTYDMSTGELTVDEEKVAVFTEKLAETYNTFKTERPFKTHSGKTITVGGGADDTYGFVLDQKGTYEVLTEAIGQSKDQFIEPAWDRKAATRDAENGDIGETYIEVSISEQHMWFYKEGKIILDTDVVTGLTSGGRNTPRGVFRVLNKMVNHTMHGSYGTAYCNYWMPLTLGGVGIHDATWRGSFGGNIYTYDGSHGCINTPLSIMPKFYENGYRGMPVIVHD